MSQQDESCQHVVEGEWREAGRAALIPPDVPMRPSSPTARCSFGHRRCAFGVQQFEGLDYRLTSLLVQISTEPRRLIRRCFCRVQRSDAPRRNEQENQERRQKSRKHEFITKSCFPKSPAVFTYRRISVHQFFAARIKVDHCRLSVCINEPQFLAELLIFNIKITRLSCFSLWR